jgi:hypothetical protein
MKEYDKSRKGEENKGGRAGKEKIGKREQTRY